MHTYCMHTTRALLYMRMQGWRTDRPVVFLYLSNNDKALNTLISLAAHTHTYTHAYSCARTHTHTIYLHPHAHTYAYTMYYGTRLQEAKLYKISSYSRKKSYETQEAVININALGTTSTIPSPLPSLSPLPQTSSTLRLPHPSPTPSSRSPGLTIMPLRSAFSATAVMNKDDSGYIGTGIDHLALERACSDPSPSSHV